MTVTFTVPEGAKSKNGFIEDEDYRNSYIPLTNNSDLYGYCGTDVNDCEVEGMTPNDKAYLESLHSPPSYESRCYSKHYNNRTDDMDDYSYERSLCEDYYDNFAVYSVDKTAAKVFIAPKPQKQQNGNDILRWKDYRPTQVMKKCFGAEQERDDPNDRSEKPKNVIPVCHKKLSICGYWLSVEQNQEFLWDWLGMVEEVEEH